MSDVDMNAIGDVPDLRHKVRRLDWFRQSLADMARTVGERYGIRYRIDDRALLAAFFEWAARFEAARKESGRNRRDFAIYAGGLMLFELLTAKPLRYELLDEPDAAAEAGPMQAICRYWPDGFLYTDYCLCIVNMILEQDFGAHDAPPRELSELRVWQSFRENFRDDPALAMAFFDVFMGVKPNWTFPDSFAMRPAVAETAGLPASDKPDGLL